MINIIPQLNSFECPQFQTRKYLTVFGASVMLSLREILARYVELSFTDLGSSSTWFIAFSFEKKETYDKEKQIHEPINESLNICIIGTM